ncbi:MAG: exosortase/archaeosortase family protein [Pseudomonadota bacterium]
MENTKKIYYQLFALGAGFIILYLPFLKTMISDWDTNANYSHGYLIPIISAWLIYSLKDEISTIRLQPSNWGIPIIIIACLQLIVAKIGMEYFLQRTSIIVLFFGISLFLYGKDITRKISIPIIYLIFMIPIPVIVWNKIAFPLQLFASYLTEHVIRLAGMPILREGNVLTLSTITLEVVDACSGIRSLTTMMALSVPFSFFLPPGKLNKVILFLSSIPIAVFANIVRLTATAFLSSLYGEKFAQGFLHEFSGMVTFVLGLAMLYGCKVVLTRIRMTK